MNASLRALAGLALLLAALFAGVGLCPSPALAQEEARLLFDRGNQHLARGLRARGRGRERELTEAIDAYLGVLRLGTRTRNVVFNLALAHAELAHDDEAFNYYGEYLRAFDLSEDEQAEGRRRQEAIRPRVAVIQVESTPPGAEVRVGRRDLPARGATPLELALSPGSHPLFLTRDGFGEATATATVVTGTTTQLAIRLDALPVDVQFIAPGHGALTLDGAPVEAGRTHRVAPGSHVVRLELPGIEPTERRFEVAAGDAPLVLELSGPAGSLLGARLALTVDAPAEVFVDSLRVGVGEEHDMPIPAGVHELRVTAPGRRPLVHALRLDPAERVQLAVELGVLPDATGAHAARAVLGTLASLAVVASVVIGARALSLSDEWNTAVGRQSQGSPMTERLEALASQVESAALMTDVALGITAGLGLGALVSLLVGPGDGPESSVRVIATPLSGGGAVGLAWRAP